MERSGGSELPCLDQVVEDVVEDYDDIDLDLEATTVVGYQALLARLVRNLVDNAVRHGRRDDADVAIVVRLHGRMLEVADAGPGIDPELRDELFDRFRSGSASRGSGIGLALVAWVVDAHGASIDVRAPGAGGTAIVVTFPPA